MDGTMKKEANLTVTNEESSGEMKTSEEEEDDDELLASNGAKLKSSNATAASADAVRNEIIKAEPNPAHEMLGSLTVAAAQQPVRTSARVIQKMRQDNTSNRPSTPPTIKEEKDKVAVKTPTTKILWSNTERALFFDGVNEYGRDFEAITQHINQKMKRKVGVESNAKTRDQIRQLYAQTFHKASKYVRFSEDVKKVAQELYALINYGEMRRKLPFMHEKACMKLKELIYRGTVTIREKGKTIRIKTPSCRALRKLNQLEEWQEEITLPQRVEINLVPATMEAWGHVHGLAQNPRVRTTLPLQKRVSCLLKFLQNKWRSQELRLCEKTMQMQQPMPHKSSKNRNNLAAIPIQTSETQSSSLLEDIQAHEQLLCFAPPPQTTIHRPMVNLTEFTNSNSICLNSYEERIGATSRGEQLAVEKVATNKEKAVATKRQRLDSGSDKKVNGAEKKNKVGAATTAAADGQSCSDCENKSETESSNAALTIAAGAATTTTTNAQPTAADTAKPGVICTSASSIQMIDFSAIVDNEDTIMNVERFDFFSDNSDDKRQQFQSRSDNESADAPEVALPKLKKPRDMLKSNKANFKPLISEDVIRKIKEGWTVTNCGDLTFGDLYVMFGQEFKINLEYRWMPSAVADNGTETASRSSNLPVPVAQKKEIKQQQESKSVEKLIGQRLNQLLMVAQMMEKGKKKQLCNCGHQGVTNGHSRAKENDKGSAYMDNNLFKHPPLPIRSPMAPYAYPNAQRGPPLLPYRRFKSRHNPKMYLHSRQIVQRVLPFNPMSVVNQRPIYLYDDGDGDAEDGDGDETANKLANKVTSTITKAKPATSIAAAPAATVRTVKATATTTSAVPKSPAICKFRIVSEDTRSRSSSSGVSSSRTSGHGTDDTNEDDDDDDDDDDDEEEQNEEDDDLANNPGIQCLMDISLPSLKFGTTGGLAANSLATCGDESRFPADLDLLAPRPTSWLEENINDYSFGSLLGHLDSHLKNIPEEERRAASIMSTPSAAGAGGTTTTTAAVLFEANLMRNDHQHMLSDRCSVISESSVDYVNKFAEMAAEQLTQENVN